MAAGILGLFFAGPASAHGERAEEPYQRMETVAFWDTHFTTNTVDRGGTVTITGTLKLLETWPINLSGGNPKLCYLNVVTPGATFALRDRKVNGAEAPSSFFCAKGDVFNYQLTIAGRDPGYWHVHPAIAVKDTGTLIGPGQWITVRPVGTFVNSATLFNGKGVNLENYGTPLVVGFSLLTFVLGMVWMIYWTWSKPTVTRLAVTNQLHLNDDGGDAVGLITRRDHRNTAIITGAAVLLVLVGLLYQARAFPVKIPQQSYWFTPPRAAAMPQLANVASPGSTWDDKQRVLTITVHLTNVSKSPIQVFGYHTSNLTFTNQAAQPVQPGEYALRVEPASAIEPGQTQNLKLVITQALYDEHLVVVNKPQLTVGGVLDVRDAAGARQMVTFESDVTPMYGKA